MDIKQDSSKPTEDTSTNSNDNSQARSSLIPQVLPDPITLAFLCIGQESYKELLFLLLGAQHDSQRKKLQSIQADLIYLDRQQNIFKFEVQCLEVIISTYNVANFQKPGMDVSQLKLRTIEQVTQQEKIFIEDYESRTKEYLQTLDSVQKSETEKNVKELILALGKHKEWLLSKVDKLTNLDDFSTFSLTSKEEISILKQKIETSSSSQGFLATSQMKMKEFYGEYLAKLITTLVANKDTLLPKLLQGIPNGQLTEMLWQIQGKVKIDATNDKSETLFHAVAQQRNWEIGSLLLQCGFSSTMMEMRNSNGLTAATQVKLTTDILQQSIIDYRKLSTSQFSKKLDATLQEYDLILAKREKIHKVFGKLYGLFMDKEIHEQRKEELAELKLQIDKVFKEKFDDELIDKMEQLMQEAKKGKLGNSWLFKKIKKLLNKSHEKGFANKKSHYDNQIIRRSDNKKIEEFSKKIEQLQQEREEDHRTREEERRQHEEEMRQRDEKMRQSDEEKQRLIELSRVQAEVFSEQLKQQKLESRTEHEQQSLINQELRQQMAELKLQLEAAKPRGGTGLEQEDFEKPESVDSEAFSKAYLIQMILGLSSKDALVREKRWEILQTYEKTTDPMVVRELYKNILHNDINVALFAAEKLIEMSETDKKIKLALEILKENVSEPDIIKKIDDLLKIFNSLKEHENSSSFTPVFPSGNRVHYVRFPDSPTFPVKEVDFSTNSNANDEVEVGKPAASETKSKTVASIASDSESKNTSGEDEDPKNKGNCLIM